MTNTREKPNMCKEVTDILLELSIPEISLLLQHPILIKAKIDGIQDDVGKFDARSRPGGRN